MSRQKLGQHFLASVSALERITAAACTGSTSLAIEIGPGKGALTRHLLSHFDRVCAIELDSALVAQLRIAQAGEPRLEIIERDALDVDWTAFGSGVLVGNLPYYVSTAIISKYLRSPGHLRPSVFLVQKEVAERITATPGNREFGYLSVECQLLSTVEYLFEVPPGAFKPPPKVDSAVIRLTPVAPPPDLNTERFLGFVSACFQQKRKTLRNNLLGRYSRETIDGTAEAGMRAEQLSVAGFLAFYAALNLREQGRR